MYPGHHMKNLLCIWYVGTWCVGVSNVSTSIRYSTDVLNLYSWDLLFPLTLVFFFSKGYPQPWNLHFGLGGSKQGECKVEIGVFCQGIVPREIKKGGGYLFWRRGNECIILMATLVIVIIFCFLFEKEAYGMKSLLPEDWDDLVHLMASNTTLFNTFYK